MRYSVVVWITINVVIVGVVLFSDTHYIYLWVPYFLATYLLTLSLNELCTFYYAILKTNKLNW
jgi:hypothetical protein